MQTVSDFIAKVGRDRFTEGTGYSPQVISRAISENIMPAGWYVRVRDSVCNPLRIPVPEHLFRWDDRRKTPAHVGAAE